MGNPRAKDDQRPVPLRVSWYQSHDGGTPPASQGHGRPTQPTREPNMNHDDKPPPRLGDITEATYRRHITMPNPSPANPSTQTPPVSAPPPPSDHHPK